MSKQRVGVIGGGQLAWMMASAAKEIGFDLIVQTPREFDPAVSLATEVIFAPIDDAEATAQLATCCQVITFENEFVDLVALQKLADKGITFLPKLSSLNYLLDKYDQRCFLESIHLPTPQFTLLENRDQVNHLTFPIVLKARRHGYDGQGTFICHSKEALEDIWQKFNFASLLLEEYIPFQKELAVIAARNQSGKIVIYPVVETQQENQVCRRVIAPAQITREIEEKIKIITEILLEKIDAVGVFGIELFLTNHGQVFVNEIAPRTHNSGHYTMDACNISQFEMHLRAVTDLPLEKPFIKSEGAIMVNLLGYESSSSDYLEKRELLAQIPHSYLHWYGKTESRPGRKLGHINVLLNSDDDGAKIIAKIESIWYN